MKKIFSIQFGSDTFVKLASRKCEGKHVQQIVFSSYHNALTQICFGCKTIRTSMNRKDANSQQSVEVNKRC